MRALVISAPTASGLSSPLASLAGPRPMKIARPEPAKTWAAVPLASVIARRVASPSMRDEVADVERQAGDGDLELRSPRRSAKRIAIERVPSRIVSSIVVPVVLMRSSARPPAAIGPAWTSILPEAWPAMPVGGEDEGALALAQRRAVAADA